jgi:hypothetical protein
MKREHDVHEVDKLAIYRAKDSVVSGWIEGWWIFFPQVEPWRMMHR